MNKEERKIYAKEHYLKNKEHYKAVRKEWVKNNQDKVRATRKRYYAKNIDSLREKARNQEKFKIPFFKWAYYARISHRQRGNIINVTTEELITLAKDNPNCQICGVKLWSNGAKPDRKGDNYMNALTLDRINNETIINKDNVLIVCNHCNMSKGRRTLKEFIEYCSAISDRFKGVL